MGKQESAGWPTMTERRGPHSVLAETRGCGALLMVTELCFVGLDGVLAKMLAIRARSLGLVGKACGRNGPQGLKGVYLLQNGLRCSMHWSQLTKRGYVKGGEEMRNF